MAETKFKSSSLLPNPSSLILHPSTITHSTIHHLTIHHLTIPYLTITYLTLIPHPSFFS